MPISRLNVAGRLVLSAIVVVLAIMNFIYWEHRLAAYRKDRQWEHTTYGLPVESRWASFDRSKFTKAATGAYYARIASAIVLYAAIATAIWAWSWAPATKPLLGG
jgi:hypothetical protein